MPKTQFQPKKQNNQSVSPKHILRAIVAVVIFFLLLVSVINLAQKYVTLHRHISDLQAQQSTLAEKETTLATTDEYLSTPEGQEQELRDKYNLVRPGEHLVVITTADDTTPPPPQSTIARWWDAILKGLGIRK